MTVANLVVRGVPSEVFEAFRARAASEGRSMKFVLIQLMARWVLEDSSSGAGGTGA
jgi:plasmid stability protein